MNFHNFKSVRLQLLKKKYRLFFFSFNPILIPSWAESINSCFLKECQINAPNNLPLPMLYGKITIYLKTIKNISYLRFQDIIWMCVIHYLFSRDDPKAILSKESLCLSKMSFSQRSQLLTLLRSLKFIFRKRHISLPINNF